MPQEKKGSDEPQFQEWYARHAQQQKLDPNPDDPRHFYDYRGAFRSGATPDASGHWPSTFKREGHPDLYIDGIDTRTGRPVSGDEQWARRPKAADVGRDVNLPIEKDAKGNSLKRAAIIAELGKKK